ncbi:hypothetical protein, variant [Spizellomyces punctatus DAOM BR117]|uniref:Uncharacterized protein n=1 Tax=Spizellomyces punctatus (strain DAOM BR117) TaxID=645134 RepID=A0A0L0HNF3_SPIPD|nr:hypothetical protein, variant [Spizellomyces punctatus DAOM BR117]KND02602.1 hypothetical protein, variant [Spizellomyces punctatus DAOM BR117]|eukprot:XP_016610641.1 hypothetical protein, variant [Spizellomyces punctatus DAOM BR117]
MSNHSMRFQHMSDIEQGALLKQITARITSTEKRHIHKTSVFWEVCFLLPRPVLTRAFSDKPRSHGERGGEDSEMSIVFLLALAEFGLAVRAGHVLGILTTLLCLAQLYASARLGTGILATTLVYLGMILRTYIAALVYIQVRSVWKGKIWTEFPGQYDKNAGNIVRSARDDNVRCGALAGPLRFPASSDRIGSLISRWTEQTEGVRVKSVHLGNKEGFRHSTSQLFLVLWTISRSIIFKSTVIP